MKIDRAKLNTLLRSGLNPEIKTRKQLAAHLGLDPTSITRWFASRDRLGNPRYPVIPDRHVTKILQLFNLEPQWLALNDEEFRHHCFDMSLQHTKDQDDLEQKDLLRLENVAQRKLTINQYTTQKNGKVPLLIAATLLCVVGGWFFTVSNPLGYFKSTSTAEKSASTKTKCWVGYAPSLGDFNGEDKADPCHYRKLLHNAVTQLKAINNSPNTSASSGELAASQDYILFLAEQLEQRRIIDKITLNMELGKSELHRLNYLAAQQYFQIASDILASSSNQTHKLS